MIINGIEYFDPHKEKPTDKIYWLTPLNEEERQIGEHLFSFDKKTVYNLFEDYPHKLSKNEQEIFAKEQPYWYDFFNSKDK